MSYRIEGVLTNSAEPFFAPGFTGIIRPGSEGPFDPDDPDPGEFGYYGEGPGGLDGDGNPTVIVEPIYPRPDILDC